MISEPWCFSHINGHFNRKSISVAEYKRLLRSMVRVLCCKRDRDNVDHIFIKMTIFGSVAFPFLKEMFPEARFIFITRNFKPTMQSMLHLNYQQPMLFYITGAFFQVCTCMFVRTRFPNKRRTVMYVVSEAITLTMTMNFTIF